MLKAFLTKAHILTIVAFIVTTVQHEGNTATLTVLQQSCFMHINKMIQAELRTCPDIYSVMSCEDVHTNLQGIAKHICY